MSFAQAPSEPTALRRGIWCLAALACAGAGQIVLSRAAYPLSIAVVAVAWGSFLLFAGAVLFAFAWRRYPRIDPLADAGARPSPPRDRRWWIVAAAALALWATALVVQERRGESAGMRLAWGASVALLAVAAWRSQPRPAPVPDQDPTPRALATAAAAAIGVAAFLLRFAELETLPLAHHGDMAMMGLSARELLRGDGTLFGVGWASIPWAGYLPAALSMALFGDDLFGLRMAAVAAGTVAVIATYGIGATLHSRRVGLLASAVGAIGYIDIHFGRIPAYVDPLPWLAVGLLLVLRGLRGGRDVAFLGGGMLLGWACLLYFSGRIAPLVLAVWLLHLALFQRRLLRARWQGIALFALGAVVAVGPMLVFYAQHPNVVLGRGGVFLWNPETMAHLRSGYGVDSAAAVLFEQAWRSLLLFNYGRSGSIQLALPRIGLNPWLAPFLALGAGWVASRLRSAGPPLAAWWLAVVLVVGSILTLDAPFWPRLVVLLPAAGLVTAFGLDRTIVAAAGLLGRRPGAERAVAVAAAALLLLVGAANWRIYTTRMRVWVEPADWLGRVVAEAPGEHRFCMVVGPRSFREEHLRFLADGRDLRDVPADQIDAHLLPCLAEGRIWVIYEPAHRELLAELRARWPDAREERHEPPMAGPGPLLWYPPPAAVEEARPIVELPPWPAERTDAAGSPLVESGAAIRVEVSSRPELAALTVDGDRTTAWSGDGPQRGGEWLLLRLPTLARVTEIRLDCQRLPQGRARGLALETSTDGVVFAPVAAEVALDVETRIVPKRPLVGRWLRLLQTGEDQEQAWHVFELAVYGRLGDGEARFERADLRAARLGSYRVELAGGLPNAIDGDAATRWDSGRPQQGGEWLGIELPAVSTVADLWLDTASSPNDYPRGLAVLHSLDGEAFAPARTVQSGTTRLHVAFDPPLRTRFLRLEQTGRHERFYWSVHDIELWGDWSPPLP